MEREAKTVVEVLDPGVDADEVAAAAECCKMSTASLRTEPDEA